MSLRHPSSLLTIATALLAAPSLAQDYGEFQDESGIADDGTIVVTGQRIPGQLNVEQAPILELDEGDIAAYGAGSITELVQAVQSQTGSSRGRGGGRPVFLINGIRVSGFREFRSYPPEAIRKVEVLPEEVAQRFGFPPDRRVMNFILKDDFSSREVEFEIEAPDRGGYWRNEQEATLLTIANGGRLNIDIAFEDVSGLTEGERGVLQAQEPEAGEPDPAFFRSLIADSFSAEATVNWAKSSIENGSSISFNGTYEREESERLSGLDPALEFAPLRRRSSSDSISSAASYNRPLGSFQLSSTLDANYTRSRDLIDRRGDDAIDRALSEVVTFTNKNTISGMILALPAGDLSTTFDLGLDWQRLQSEDTRSALPADLTRRRLSTGANIVMPVAERGGAWGAIGNVTLNLSAGLEDLSDFGLIGDYTYGVTWGPTGALELSATRIITEAAPSLTQLGNPTTQTLNVPVFDFAMGDTVLATIVSGGNPDLIAEKQRDWKFSANWEVPFIENTRLSVDYIRNRSDDVSSAFPALTPAIEAAFPDRVTRDTDGTLLAIDRRPVTFSETRAERLVIGLTRRGSFGEAGTPQGRGREGARGGAERSPMNFGRDSRGRYFVNINHTIELENTVLVRNDGPFLDLLDGDGASGFGLSQHTSTLEAGFFRNGKGIRVSGRYTGPSRISTGLEPGVDTLRFGSLAQLDLRVFANLGRVLKQETGLLDGLRLALVVDNVFDGRRKVTDSAGETPLAYQPFLVDPTGRYLGIDVRKMF